MGTAIASGRARSGPARAAAVDAADLRAALDEALAAAEADERLGPLLRAAGLRMRFEFPDAGLVVNVASADSPDRHIRWSFTDDVDWRPKLELVMDSQVANRYLQGRESLPIAIARGQVRFRGESRAAVLYLPVARLLCEPYRRVIAAGHPDLVVT